MAIAEVLVYALIPAGVAIVGATFAAFRPPGAKVRSYLQHFAAGVVFAVVGVELLPDVTKGHSPVWTAIGFSLGVAVMLGIKAVLGKVGADPHAQGEEGEKLAQGEKPGEHAEPAGSEAKKPVSPAMLVGISVDIVIDGLLIGVGFAAGAKEGKMLTVALAIEVLSLALALAASMRNAGSSIGKTIGTTSGITSLILVGAAIGATLLQSLAPHLLVAVLSFGLAALLYLVTEELLTEAHEEKETPLSTATFFFGFLIFLVLSLVA